MNFYLQVSTQTPLSLPWFSNYFRLFLMSVIVLEIRMMELSGCEVDPYENDRGYLMWLKLMKVSFNWGWMKKMKVENFLE